MAHIFISHKSDNREQAEEARDWLVEEGFQTFLSSHPEDGIAAGAKWEETLYDEIGRTDAVLALVSEAAIRSHWVSIELAFALARDLVIVPLQLAGAKQHPMLHAPQAKPWPAGAPLPVDALKRGLLKAGLEPDKELPWHVPYVGLRALEMADAGVLFGRDQEIRELLHRVGQGGHVARNRFVAVAGASGSGKSSLVRAGLAERLAKADDWVVLRPTTPGGDPFAALARNIAGALHPEEAIPSERPRYQAEIDVDDPQAAGLALVQRAADVAAAGGHPDARVLLVVDQGEELLGPSEHASATSTRFLSALHVAVTSSRQLRVVLVFRSQDLQDLLVIAPPGLIKDPYVVNPLSDDEIRRVIEGPAGMVNLEFAPGLIDTMVDQARGGDVLPMLSFALRRLYDEGGRDLYISQEEYDSIGGVNEAIAFKANEIYESHRSSDDVLRALLELVAIWPGQVKPARRRVERTELGEATLAILDEFVEARLVTARGDDVERTVELAHEAVLRVWEPLADAINDNRAQLEVKTRLRPTADQWVESGSPKDETLSSRLLLADLHALGYGGGITKEALSFLETIRESLGKRVTDFLTESVRQERRRKWLRRAGSTAAAVVVAAVIVGGYFVYQRLQLKETAQGEKHRFAASAPLLSVLEPLSEGDDLGFVTVASLERRDIPSFELDLHEVTNRQYRACVRAGQCSRPRQPGNFAGIDDDARLDIPVVFVDAFQAAQFCAWIDRRLPERDEWERAVRGVDGRPWPWEGDEPPGPARANIGSARERPSAVGEFVEGVSSDGVADLIGNVKEWTATPGTNCRDRCPDPWDGQDPDIQSLAVVGLSWDDQVTDGDEFILGILYGGEIAQPTEALEQIGFRCAD